MTKRLDWDDWQQEFFDWSCNATGGFRLVIEGQYDDISVTLEEGGRSVSEGYGETLTMAMRDCFERVRDPSVTNRAARRRRAP